VAIEQPRVHWCSTWLNAERIAYFCGRKERDKLSLKTNPDSIDDRRQSLQERVRLFGDN